MNTKSIEEYIYSLENPKECKELTINKLSITGEVQTVDLNDLYNFPKLESLSLCNMTFGENDLLILGKLENLKVLKLYNCDFSNDNLYAYFNSIEIEELVIDNTEMNFNAIKKKYNKVIAKNVANIYDINCNELDISKAITVDFQKLYFEKYEKLIINKFQYLSQKNIFIEYKNNIELVVKDDYYDEMGDIYE